MSNAVLLVILILIVAPPVVSGCRGKSPKFTIIFTFVMVSYLCFDKIMGYVNSGHLGAAGAPSIKQYTITHLMLLPPTYVAYLALTLLMYWIGTQMRKNHLAGRK